MARKIVYQLVDDLDGTLLAEGEGETIQFSIDGNDLEIDLSNDHAKLFRAATQKYVKAARPVGKSGRRGPGRSAQSGPKRDLGAIRAWASENGYTVSSRGRIPNAVIEAYEAANGK
ncbi:Lsr2 family protein [Pseudoclavibacter endophyticus]|uniref:Lsr2 family protein n=1 Tax=Pseudoclavibacter endophyticus TaxID=1778590 RepID=A0A6H9WLS1_9MICO|nr:Lsr2 family protein [Pseudoclavibacter endophyticus]KAB1646862.1 Lsr2 family protein [Pseudoclavibacter endophyticus]GGA74918.1 Lsr2 family protein [Pseudoclavibacter endophyticus]